ncbi:MAG: hypothetical protein GXP54_02650, partial [Deltaproteobacteria bacterium]|nr:hypothetical protein [Deltaproteobacteria bacterium]
LYNHYGNCGELQDVVTAAARTSLIPMMNVSDPNEDHVWNEFYSPQDGKWHTFQVSWSDGITIIDDAKGAAEKLTGGGKDISMVQGYRGDGFMINRTSKYSDTWTLNLNMTDKSGRPLDGALVMVASETYYPAPDGTYPLSIGYFGYTDTNGHFAAELGDAQNFYVRVVSKLGTWPPEANKVSQVADVSQAIPGKVIDLNSAIDEEAVINLPSLPPKAAALQPDDEWMRLDLYANGKFMVGVNPLSGDTFNREMGDDGSLNVYVLDDAGLAAWKAGEPTQALWGATGIDKKGAVICGPTPTQGEAHVVVVAPEHLGISTAFAGTVSLNAVPATGDLTSSDGLQVEGAVDEAVVDAAEHAQDSAAMDDLTAEDNQVSAGSSNCSMGNGETPGLPVLILLCVVLAALVFRSTFERRRDRLG